MSDTEEVENERPPYVYHDGMDAGKVRQHKALVKHNDETAQMLADKYKYGLNPEVVVAAAMDLKIQQVFEKLFPEGSAERLDFDIAWQKRIEEMLDQVKGEAPEAVRRQAEMQLGMQPGGGLILPGLPDLRRN